MDMILEVEAAGLMVRAARCDGAHERPVLASRRLIVNGVTFDCCAHHLREVVQMARLVGALYRIEAVADRLACGVTPR